MGGAAGGAASSILMAAGPLLAVGAAALATVKGLQALNARMEKTFNQLAPLSATLSAVQARNEILDTLHDMRRARRLGGTVGRFQTARAELGRELTDMGDTFMQTFGEMLIPLIENATAVAEWVNENGEIIKAAAGGVLGLLGGGVPGAIIGTWLATKRSADIQEAGLNADGDFWANFDDMDTVEDEVLKDSEVTGELVQAPDQQFPDGD